MVAGLSSPIASQFYHLQIKTCGQCNVTYRLSICGRCHMHKCGRQNFPKTWPKHKQVCILDPNSSPSKSVTNIEMSLANRTKVKQGESKTKR